MMHHNLPMSPTEVAAIAVAVCSVIGTIASLAYAFRNNASGIKNDIIKTYETRLDQMRDDLDKVQEDLKEVKALLEKSEEERLKAVAILQGRNPEFDKYMALSLQLLTDIHGAVMPQTVHKESSPT